MYDNEYDNVLVALVRYRNNIPQTNWLNLRFILFEKKNQTKFTFAIIYLNDKFDTWWQSRAIF